MISAIPREPPARAERRPRNRERLFAAFVVLLVAAVAEGAAAIASAVLVARGAMADVPRLSEEEIAVALARRSPRLGWGPPTDALGHVSAASPRPDPAFPPDRPACMSIYGDSFTLGAADDATYPHDLAVRLGCPVANYGVGGYGSDQSLMLFEAQRAVDRAPIAVLAHLSENVMRNVNQYQRLLYPASRIRFKPRFLLERGDLRWLPIPVQDADDYRAVADDPGRFLAHDALIDRPRPGFPYTLQLLRWLATDSYVRARLRGRPWHAGFYAVDDPSGALRLTARILSRFAEEARADGRTPVVFLLPMRSDLAWARRTGRWADRPLAAALAADGIPFVDAGPGVLARLGGEDVDRLFAADGHPNARGYSVLAEALEEGLASLGIAERVRREPS